jgi:hypothetical protein
VRDGVLASGEEEEVSFWDSIAQAWKMGKAEACAPWPAECRVTGGDKKNVEWMKQAIVDTGYALWFRGVTEIRFQSDLSWVPNLPPGALATIWGSTIQMLDKGYMPGWDLPGTAIHEAVHVWQQKNGLMGNVVGREIAAYQTQQDFEYRYCWMKGKVARNLFKERPGAVGLLSAVQQVFNF